MERDILLAEATNLCSIQLLKFGKKHIAQIIESMKLEEDIEDILKSLVKNQIHMTAENIIQNISTLADNKEDYFNYLFKLEEESKKKY